MNIGKAQKRITLYVILPAFLAYLSLRLYAQFRHLDIYVSSVAPMPTELADGLHMKAHRIDPMVRIESPYDGSTNKVLSPDEIRHLRTTIAWSSTMPAFIDSLIILSPTNVVGRQIGKKFMREYQLVKLGDRWVIEGATRTEINRYTPK